MFTSVRSILPTDLHIIVPWVIDTVIISRGSPSLESYFKGVLCVEKGCYRAEGTTSMYINTYYIHVTPLRVITSPAGIFPTILFCYIASQRVWKEIEWLDNRVIEHFWYMHVFTPGRRNTEMAGSSNGDSQGTGVPCPHSLHTLEPVVLQSVDIHTAQLRFIFC